MCGSISAPHCCRTTSGTLAVIAMSWFQYESEHEKKQGMERELKQRAARGEVLERLQVPAGKRKITATFWGNAWSQHIESYQDYENRLPRARNYLRQGSVFNLELEQGKIRAQVAGSTLYDVEITIKPLPRDAWREIQEACAGQVGSLLDLWSGRLGADVMAVIADKERGLFPGPREIRFNCNCPDYASLCKHSAAVLYGVGVKFDGDPALFFRLRGVDPAELISSGVDHVLAPPLETALEGEDLSALFGIDFADATEAVPPTTEVAPEKPAKIRKERRIAKKTEAVKPVSKKVSPSGGARKKPTAATRKPVAGKPSKKAG